MGELKFALNQIKKDLYIFGDIIIIAVAIYFTVQSINNIEFFNYMYVKPIVDFIDTQIIPLFAS